MSDEGQASDLARALIIAIRVHAGQLDKQGEPYLLHVLRVVETVSDEAKVVAALHDTLEDSGADPVKLFAGLPLARWEWTAVKLLTRAPRMSYRDYIESIAEGCNTLPQTRRVAREVKLADLRDNLGRLPSNGRFPDGPTTDSLRRRYEKAIATLLGENRIPQSPSDEDRLDTCECDSCERVFPLREITFSAGGKAACLACRPGGLVERSEAPGPLVLSEQQTREAAQIEHDAGEL